MDLMTETTLSLGAQRGLASRLRLWLTARRRRRTSSAQLGALSDRMLSDIGVQRDQTSGGAIRSQYDAMRYSG
jgi:uncharacterized protein YjiS (DUF1127 family)